MSVAGAHRRSFPAKKKRQNRPSNVLGCPQGLLSRLGVQLDVVNAPIVRRTVVLLTSLQRRQTWTTLFEQGVSSLGPRRRGSWSVPQAIALMFTSVERHACRTERCVTCEKSLEEWREKPTCRRKRCLDSSLCEEDHHEVQILCLRPGRGRLEKSTMLH